MTYHFKKLAAATALAGVLLASTGAALNAQETGTAGTAPAAKVQTQDIELLGAAGELKTIAEDTFKELGKILEKNEEIKTETVNLSIDIGELKDFVGKPDFDVSSYPVPAAAMSGFTGGMIITDDKYNAMAEDSAMKEALADTYGLLGVIDNYEKLGTPSGTAAAQLVALAAYSMLIADKASFNVVDSMDRLDGLTTELMKEGGNLNRTMKINSRLLVEIAQQNNEKIRLQTALSSMVAMYFAAQAAPNE